MHVNIRKVRPQDMDRIYEIELESFPPEEAASKEKYCWRQEHYPDLFLTAESDGHLCGCICMISMDAPLINDAVFEMEQVPDGRTCAILTVMTEAATRNKGVAAQLLEAAIETARRQNMDSIVLTCKDHLIHYYSRFGFEKVGVSQSVHGGAVWYDMVRPL